MDIEYAVPSLKLVRIMLGLDYFLKCQFNYILMHRIFLERGKEALIENRCDGGGIFLARLEAFSFSFKLRSDAVDKPEDGYLYNVCSLPWSCVCHSSYKLLLET